MAAQHPIPRYDDVPADVRRKIDDTGASLTGDEWRALPEVARRRLSDMPAGSPVERRAYARLLQWLLETFRVAR